MSICDGEIRKLLFTKFLCRWVQLIKFFCLLKLIHIFRQNSLFKKYNLRPQPELYCSCPSNIRSAFWFLCLRGIEAYIFHDIVRRANKPPFCRNMFRRHRLVVATQRDWGRNMPLFAFSTKMSLMKYQSETTFCVILNELWYNTTKYQCSKCKF